MVHLLKMVIFHGYVSHNQRVSVSSLKYDFCFQKWAVNAFTSSCKAGRARGLGTGTRTTFHWTRESQSSCCGKGSNPQGRSEDSKNRDSKSTVKNTHECSLLEKCPAARFGSAWQCYLMWLRIGDCGSIMTSSSSTSTRFSRQSHLMEKTVHSVEHKPHNTLTISSFMAFPICSYHSEHQIPRIPTDPHGSWLEIFMSSFMSW